MPKQTDQIIPGQKTPGGPRANCGPKPKDMLRWLRETMQLEGPKAFERLIQMSQGEHGAGPEVQYRCLCQILAYAYGKPKEQIQVTMTTRHLIEGLSQQTERREVDKALNAARYVPNTSKAPTNKDGR